MIVQKVVDDVYDIYYNNTVPWWNDVLMCWMISYPTHNGDVDIFICDEEGNVDEKLTDLWVNNPKEFERRIYTNNRKSWDR